MSSGKLVAYMWGTAGLTVHFLPSFSILRYTTTKHPCFASPELPVARYRWRASGIQVTWSPCCLTTSTPKLWACLRSPCVQRTGSLRHCLCWRQSRMVVRQQWRLPTHVIIQPESLAKHQILPPPTKKVPFFVDPRTLVVQTSKIYSVLHKANPSTQWANQATGRARDFPGLLLLSVHHKTRLLSHALRQLQPWSSCAGEWPDQTEASRWILKSRWMFSLTCSIKPVRHSLQVRGLANLLCWNLHENFFLLLPSTLLLSSLRISEEQTKSVQNVRAFIIIIPQQTHTQTMIFFLLHLLWQIRELSRTIYFQILASKILSRSRYTCNSFKSSELSTISYGIFSRRSFLDAACSNNIFKTFYHAKITDEILPLYYHIYHTINTWAIHAHYLSSQSRFFSSINGYYSMMILLHFLPMIRKKPASNCQVHEHVLRPPWYEIHVLQQVNYTPQKGRQAICFRNWEAEMINSISSFHRKWLSLSQNTF